MNQPAPHEPIPSLSDFETMLDALADGPWHLSERKPEATVYGDGQPVSYIEGAVQWRGYTNNLEVDEDAALGTFIVSTRNHLPGLIAQTRELAKGLLDIAEAASMPGTYWLTDSRIAAACKTLGITPEQAQSGERGSGTSHGD